MTAAAENWWIYLAVSLTPPCWLNRCQQNHNAKGHPFNPSLAPLLLSLLCSPSRCFLSLPDHGGDGLFFFGGVLAYSTCDGAVIRSVCKPFERCLNTPQPPFHPTHTGGAKQHQQTTPRSCPSNPSPPAAPQGRVGGDGGGDLLIIHISINRSSDARSASLRAMNAAGRLNLLMNFSFFFSRHPLL